MTPAPWWMLALFMAIPGSYLLGTVVAGIKAERERRRRMGDTAAADCPTCAALIEPASRLEAAFARVSGVEWHGGQYPPDVLGLPRSPVDDANYLLRIAIVHVQRVRRTGS